MPLSREQIFAADDMPREEVEVPEWGGSVFVAVMSGAERDQFEKDFTADRWNNPRARLAVLTVCDETGQRLFTSTDIPALNAKSSKALDRIFEVALRINKLGRDDVEALEKNSGNGRSDGSVSVSRSLSA